MRCVGKRPVYLMSLPLLAVTNIWSYKETSFNSLLAVSIVSGFAASAGDATVPAVVADLFFVHERGTLMMIFHMALSCGVFLGPHQRLCRTVFRLANRMSLDCYCIFCYLGCGHFDRP
jgi:MFS family permease